MGMVTADLKPWKEVLLRSRPYTEVGLGEVVPPLVLLGGQGFVKFSCAFQQVVQLFDGFTVRRALEMELQLSKVHYFWQLLPR